MKRILLAFALAALPTLVSAQNPVSIAQVGTTPVTTAVPVSQSGTWLMTQNGTWTMRLFDGSGNAITSTTGALDINLKSSSITLNTSAAQSGTWTMRLQDGVGNAINSTSNALNVSVTNASASNTEAATLGATQASVTYVDATLYGFDGTTNSRLRSRAGLIGSTDVGLVTRPFLPSDGTNTMPAGDSSARSIHTTVDNASVAVTGTFWQATQPVSGTVTANQGGTWTVQPGNTANTTAWLVTQPVATPFLANALSTTVVTVKGSAGTLDSYYCWNPNVAVEYVQIFDISGAVSLGTSTPKWSIGIPPTSGANLSNVNLTFANAIKVAATTSATGLSAPPTALDCNFGSR